MPRGNPKTPHSLRLDPALTGAVRKHGYNLTAAVEEALRDLLKKLARRG